MQSDPSRLLDEKSFQWKQKNLRFSKTKSIKKSINSYFRKTLEHQKMFSKRLTGSHRNFHESTQYSAGLERMKFTLEVWWRRMKKWSAVKFGYRLWSKFDRKFIETKARMDFVWIFALKSSNSKIKTCSADSECRNARPNKKHQVRDLLNRFA